MSWATSPMLPRNSVLPGNSVLPRQAGLLLACKKRPLAEILVISIQKNPTLSGWVPSLRTCIRTVTNKHLASIPCLKRSSPRSTTMLSGGWQGRPGVCAYPTVGSASHGQGQCQLLLQLGLRNGPARSLLHGLRSMGRLPGHPQ